MSGLQIQQTSHFDAIYPLLPSDLKAGIDDLLSRATRESAAKHTLDQLVRFSLGRDAIEADLHSREEWDIQKHKAEKVLSSLQSEGDSKGKKRSREEGGSGSAEPLTRLKRPRVENDAGETIAGDPLFTLHSVSVSSPVRKKVDITIYRNDAICFAHTTSDSQEVSLPLSSLTRAFVLPTPGKSKAHWTIIMLTGSDQTQVIFGLDAVPPSMTTTAHPDIPLHHPKGTESKSILMRFLSHLPPHVILQEPSITEFRSPTGDSYLDAYLRAKDGHLFFFKDGLLFGEKRPCMWIGIDKIETVRSLSATGRTFSLFITRVADASQGEEPGEGHETEFSLIDGKNQDSVALWVKNNQSRFGVHETAEDTRTSTVNKGDELDEGVDRPEKQADEDREDSDDSDFESDSGSDGGSVTSQSSNDEGNESQSDPEEEAHSESDGDEDADLLPSRHPLLRPGAMPKISKAAINAVVGMIEEDLADMAGAKAGSGGDEGELDELED